MTSSKRWQGKSRCPYYYIQLHQLYARPIRPTETNDKINAVRQSGGRVWETVEGREDLLLLTKKPATVPVVGGVWWWESGALASLFWGDRPAQHSATQLVLLAAPPDKSMFWSIQRCSRDFSSPPKKKIESQGQQRDEAG